MKHYVLTSRRYDTNTAIRIVGPFKSEGKAAKWGTEWQYATNDNPNWSVVYNPIIRIEPKSAQP